MLRDTVPYCITLPHKVKVQYMHFRSHTEYFLLPWKIPEEISRWLMFYHNYKGSIYYTKHMYIQPFSIEVDWPEIWCLMKISTMFYICTYCIFTLWGSSGQVLCKLVALIFLQICTITLKYSTGTDAKVALLFLQCNYSVPWTSQTGSAITSICSIQQFTNTLVVT